MATLEQIMSALPKADAAGDTEAVEQLSSAMRAHPTFQQNAKEKLDSGLYKIADDGYTQLDKDQERANMSKYMARSLGLKDSEVDVTQGMGTYGRFKLGFQPTEQDKVKHLEDTYGRENIRATEVGGKMKLLYRDEQETGGQFRAVDEEGVSLADFFGDIAGYAPEVAGAIAGGIKGAAIGTLAGGPVGTVVGGALGAAGAGFATATAQDVATRALSDEDIQLGEIAGRRGKEALIGGVADVALLGTGRVASKFLRKSGLRESAGEAFADSVETVRQAGGEVGETAGVRGGGKTLEKEMLITQARPSSKVAKINEKTRASMINLADEMSGKSTPVEAAARIAENAKSGKLDLEDFIREADSRAGKVISDAKLGSLERFSTLTDDMDRFGGDYKELLTKLGQGADETVKQKYALRDQLAEQLNVGVSKKKLLKSIDAGIAKEPKFNNATMRAARQRVADGDDFIPFNDLDAELALVRDAIPDSSQTKSTGQRLASLVAEEVGSLRSKTARSAGTEFNRAFLDANKFVKEEALGFRRGAVGKALKEQVGDNVATNQDVARAVFKDAETVREVLQTASNADAFVQAEARAGRTADPLRSASEMEKDLRRQFMSQLGFDKGTTPASAAKLSKNQKEVMAQLWSGPNAKGITDKGRRKVAEYEQLMKKVEQSGVKVPQLGVDEVDEYLSAFSTDKRNKVKSELVARAKKRDELRIFEENTLIKKALKGEAGDHLRSKKFGDAIVGQTTEGQAKQFMADIVPAEDIPFVRQNVIESLIAKSGGESGAGWDSKSMRKLLNRQDGTLKAVLGREDYKLIHSINDVMERVQKQFATSSAGEVRPRAIISQGGISGYLSGDIMRSIGNRFYGWAYGTGVLKDLFVSGSQKASRDAWNNALGKMIGTSQGLQALDHATSEDPDSRGTMVEELAMQPKSVAK